jgi:hypothetical protein
MMWRDHVLRTGHYKGTPVPPEVLEAIKAATLAHWERQARGEGGKGYALWSNPTFPHGDSGMEWRVSFDGTVDLVPRALTPDLDGADF